MEKVMESTVYLLGCGCGTVDYLTVRGYELLKRADVVIFDALIDRDLLDLLPLDCDRIDVGKRGGQPSLKQSEIDRILVNACVGKACVIRLKTGDPFIFGRTTSEIQALRDAGINYEVIPGISSAIAAPLFASIPLTDAVLSRSFTVLSAHEPDTIDWAIFAPLDTLVILMGARSLPQIVSALVHQGRSTETAIAIIRWAGQPEQRVWVGTLGSIMQITKGESLSPCVIVIGEVVRLREFLLPLDTAQDSSDLLSNTTSNLDSSDLYLSDNSTSLITKSLSAHTVLVTRSVEQSPTFSNLLIEQGAKVVEMPTLEIFPPSDWCGLDQAIAQIQTYDWLVLTSANAVNYFFNRLILQGQDLRTLANCKIAVVGKKTAKFLKARGFTPDFTPPEFVADSLIDHFPTSIAGLKVLFPRVESGGRDVLVKSFIAAGAIVNEVAAYQSGCPTMADPMVIAALKSGKITIVTFASSKTVQHFYQLVQSSIGSDLTAILKNICIASIGPQTSKTCQELLGRVDVEATEYTLEGLVDRIVRSVQS
jgi:uroporphyrinogen III methyltransferase/synthase